MQKLYILLIATVVGFTSCKKDASAPIEIRKIKVTPLLYNKVGASINKRDWYAGAMLSQTTIYPTRIVIRWRQLAPSVWYDFSFTIPPNNTGIPYPLLKTGYTAENPDATGNYDQLKVTYATSDENGVEFVY